MPATREKAMAALFDLLRSAYPFRRASRRIELIDQVQREHRPALFLAKHAETYEKPSPNVPRKLTLHCFGYVYIDAKDETAVGDSLINEIMDAIDAAMTPDFAAGSEGRQTLGGLVHSVRIAGTAQEVPGDIDGEGLYAFPIDVLMP